MGANGEHSQDSWWIINYWNDQMTWRTKAPNPETAIAQVEDTVRQPREHRLIKDKIYMLPMVDVFRVDDETARMHELTGSTAAATLITLSEYIPPCPRPEEFEPDKNQGTLLISDKLTGEIDIDPNALPDTEEELAA